MLQILELLPLAETVDKLRAVCSGCGGDAAFTQRLSSDAQVEVGLAVELCYNCCFWMTAVGDLALGLGQLGCRSSGSYNLHEVLRFGCYLDDKPKHKQTTTLKNMWYLYARIGSGSSIGQLCRWWAVRTSTARCAGVATTRRCQRRLSSAGGRASASSGVLCHQGQSHPIVELNTLRAAYNASAAAMLNCRPQHHAIRVTRWPRIPAANLMHRPHAHIPGCCNRHSHADVSVDSILVGHQA